MSDQPSITLHPVTRSQDEIVARIEQVLAGGGDLFGAEQSELMDPLDFEHAKRFLKDGVTAEEWAAAQAETGGTAHSARTYVPFAVGKIRDHRGLSAGRSVDHFRGWAWLMGWDLPDEPYAQYGAPLVYAFLEHFGWLDLWPADAPDLERMRRGQPCELGCIEGCG